MKKPKDQFERKYSAFSSYATEFSDPPNDDEEDGVLARKIGIGLERAERIRIIEQLLSDSDRILSSIDTDWLDLRRFVNRFFIDSGAAKEWLLFIQRSLRKELVNLKHV